MNRRRISLRTLAPIGLFALVLAAPAAASAPEEKKAPAKSGPSQDEMMAEMMKYATPGFEHSRLRSLAGSWKAVTKSWMAPGEPEVSEGTAKGEWMLGGRYLKEEYKSTFAGMPFEGLGITGYDNYRKEYFNVWFDTFGTGVLVSTGAMDAAGTTLTMTGVYDDPSIKQKKTMKLITKFVSDTQHVVSMYEVDAKGKETRVMETTYTRQ